jgi:hypothetical protein
MSGRPGRPAALAIALVLALGPRPAFASFGTVQVQIRLPVDASLETHGIRRILVGGFLTGDYDRINVPGEAVRLLRSTMKKHTDFLIIDDPPPSLPEQRLDELKTNSAFFETIGREFSADLIVAGEVDFTGRDASGFVQEEVVSSTTGRRSVRTRYVERTDFKLRLDLIFLNGRDGSLLYETTFSQDEMLDAEEADALSAFYALADRFLDSYLRILTPGEQVETRTLFTD